MNHSKHKLNHPSQNHLKQPPPSFSNFNVVVKGVDGQPLIIDTTGAPMSLAPESELMKGGRPEVKIDRQMSKSHDKLHIMENHKLLSVA